MHRREGKTLGSAVRRIWNQISTGSTDSVDLEFWYHRRTVAALLFRVMPIDGDIHVSEQIRLNRILADEFAIDDDEVDELVREAREGRSSKDDIDVLSRKLDQTLTHPDKLILISHIWEMIFADGRLHEYELLLVERVASLMGVSTKDVIALMNCNELETDA